MKTVIAVLCFVMAASLAAGKPDPRSDPRVSVEVRAIGALVIKQVLPKYPAAMRQRGLEGIVELDVMVDADGMVVGITTVSATNGTFVGPARNAIWQWEFAKSEQMLPGEQVRYRLPVEFRLGRG